MGNSRWRLETTLNYAGKRVLELGRENDVEIMVSDWGSDVPLREVVTLDPSVARLVSFLLIPPAVARDLQKDSAFPEVLALNAAARRASGEYIGRIDQDTLVGKRFFGTFFDLYEGRRQLDVRLEAALLFANIRMVPYRFAARCPPFPVVEQFVSMFGRRFPVQLTNKTRFYKHGVGIWLVHRRLWYQCGGYDERMIYMNVMEINMIRRLMQKYELVNLGALIDYDFYHLEHYLPWVPRQSSVYRRINRGYKPNELNPNGDGWGLAGYNLEAKPPSSMSRAPSVADPHSGGRIGVLLLLPLIGLRMAGDTVWAIVHRARRSILQFVSLWSHRVGVARATVRGRSVVEWPRLLQGRLRQRKENRIALQRSRAEE